MLICELLLLLTPSHPNSLSLVARATYNFTSKDWEELENVCAVIRGPK